MNKKISHELMIVIVLLVIVSLGIGFWLGNRNKNNMSEQIGNRSEEAIVSEEIDSVPVSESENEVKKCGEDKIICPDGILTGRMQNADCSFPECPRGRYDMLDATFKTYQNNELGIEFRYPKEFTIVEDSEHESNYDGDLVVKLKRYDSKNNQHVIKLYFSKNLALYPDLIKTTARLREETGRSVNEIHRFGAGMGFEGYEMFLSPDIMRSEIENWHFLKLENGFFYFNDVRKVNIKSTWSTIEHVMSTFRSMGH